MSLIDKQLQEVWNALRADSLQRHDTLRAIRIKHLRGIRDLRVPFQYPVSVLAGPNGCGNRPSCSPAPAPIGIPSGERASSSPAACFPTSSIRNEGPCRTLSNTRSWSSTTCYRNLSVISAQTRTLLFAQVDDLPAGYSEFHMSSGERAILRISKDISALQGALVLIDEVEAGLHPYTQQQAMLELQRIALRKKLQVVVASHSPVVLDSVPPEARIFLDREADTADVRVMPVFRDIFQKALYGQTRDRLSVLCEDAVAEEIIRGVLDVLNLEMALRHDDVVVGRNTGRDDFPGHVRTLGAVDKLGDFLLVLDGDSRHLEATIKAVAADYGHSARLLFLPGEEPPERWIWNALDQHAEDYAPVLGSTSADLKARMREIDRLGEGAVRQRHAAKNALFALSEELNSTVENVARIVARTETEANRGDTARFRIELGEQIDKWRQDAP